MMTPNATLKFTTTPSPSFLVTLSPPSHTSIPVN